MGSGTHDRNAGLAMNVVGGSGGAPVPQEGYVLEARGLTKRYGSLLANKDVRFGVRRGEIVALLGENGAGKTTLMNMLFGMTAPDSGSVLIDGEAIRLQSPRDALALGIGMVHQHFMLVPPFTVAENIALGVEPSRRGMLDLGDLEAQITALGRRFGIDIDPRALVKDLSVGQQQRVEIIKALYRGARVMILDEPTAVLTPQEADDLFKVLRGLAHEGTGIVFISHKLREVLDLAHRIVVMRRGAVAGEVLPRDASPESLASLMVGRDVLLRVEKAKSVPGKPMIVVRDLVVNDDRRVRAVDGVSLSVRTGEIVGVAGVQGNGQTELVEAITGLRTTQSGSFHLSDRDLTRATVRDRTDAGLAHIPEDRQRHGLVLPFTVEQNMILNRYYRAPFSRWLVMQAKAMRDQARDLVGRFDVRPANPEAPVGSLSGGNKQKVIIARELSRDVRALVAAQPTRGVDVGSIEFIHAALIAARDAGAAVLLVSAELDELLAVSDRIMVMFRGRIVGAVDSATASREDIGLMMAGGVSPEVESVTR